MKIFSDHPFASRSETPTFRAESPRHPGLKAGIHVGRRTLLATVARFLLGVALVPPLACQDTAPPPSGPAPTPAPTTAGTPSASAAIPAFPGAEGFGALATGGRGGAVIYVTTLAPDGPGSLAEALATAGPRYVLFKVSGVIDGLAEIERGDVTLAGQTSPGGIIVRGLLCADNYEADDCRNVIVRHVRSRPRPADQYPGQGDVLDDALRLDGARQVIIDHSSFANAVDEVAQVSEASDITIQRSLLAETVGSHYEFGGMLINYSTRERPLTRISLHHNVWNRIYQRMPEISCESPSCDGHRLALEITSNLLWDAGFPLTYSGAIDPAGGPGRFYLDFNWVQNYMITRPDYPYGMIFDAVTAEAQNSLYWEGNHLALYPGWSDYQLAYCCNDFAQYGPNQTPPAATVRAERHDFPAISVTPYGALAAYALSTVGAMPRDPMDRRLLDWVRRGEIDPTPWGEAGADDAHDLDFSPAEPPSPPADRDADGMPDDWEQTYGLNPDVQDHNGTQLSVLLTGVSGYTNLECYLNLLADGSRVPVRGSSQVALAGGIGMLLVGTRATRARRARKSA
ncbi:MAG: hypothetical protein HYV63_08345 [Candidatus Schekmanbacteria bacterium]|nr:hypothetical protein [Candidatus Schekmanbacteria bacterium]